MQLLSLEELTDYVRSNYELFVELRTNDEFGEIPAKCDSCHRDVFMKVRSKDYSPGAKDAGLPGFTVFFIECPKCRRKSFINTVKFDTVKSTPVGPDSTTHEYFNQYYKIFKLPIVEESFANQDIPVEYSTLRNTVSEANFALSHSKNLSAAILFRRAIQILSKDILGAIGRTLHAQLEWLKSNDNRLQIPLIDVFHDNARILKDIGNQGAHPDDDITLHDFSKDDADGLHDLFLSIIYEVFTKPAKMKALQDELKSSRKLKN